MDVIAAGSAFRRAMGLKSLVLNAPFRGWEGWSVQPCLNQFCTARAGSGDFTQADSTASARFLITPMLTGKWFLAASAKARAPDPYRLRQRRERLTRSVWLVGGCLYRRNAEGSASKKYHCAIFFGKVRCFIIAFISLFISSCYLNCSMCS